jgi:hypothetical protein
MKRLIVCTLAGWLAFAGLSHTLAQYGDLKGLKILKPEDTQDMPSTPPPKGALDLFDGKSLDGWVSARDPNKKAPWKLLDSGVMQSGGGDVRTAGTFAGNFRLHVEFRVPYEPKNKGQGRGNSGVYVQGRYEVQILDSYGLKSGNQDCGAIYEVAAPKENVCKAPTVWQSYDIEFTSPKCADGNKTAPARMTVYHNGVKVHDDVAIPVNNTRAGLGGDPCTPGPIMLQDHGHPVQFRNIWLSKKG